MPINWKIAIDYANLVNIAYSVEPQNPYTQKQYDAITAAGYNFLQPLYGDDIATETNPTLGRTVTIGFLAVSPSRKELVAAIRGTEGVWEWIDDARFLMIPCPIAGAKGFTEDGFSTVYKSLRIGSDTGATSAKDSIKNYLDQGVASSVTVCGHSLGGALATLLTLDVALNTPCTSPQSYTYASPRTGDHIFADAYNASVPGTYRVFNRKDLVPKLPPPLPLPYEHVNTPEELNPANGSINPTIACMHILTTYLWLMGQLLPGPNPYQLNGCAPPTGQSGM
jgi:hypothetical protein